MQPLCFWRNNGDFALNLALSCYQLLQVLTVTTMRSLKWGVLPLTLHSSLGCWVSIIVIKSWSPASHSTTRKSSVLSLCRCVRPHHSGCLPSPQIKSSKKTRRQMKLAVWSHHMLDVGLQNSSLDLMRSLSCKCMAVVR